MIFFLPTMPIIKHFPNQTTLPTTYYFLFITQYLKSTYLYIYITQHNHIKKVINVSLFTYMIQIKIYFNKNTVLFMLILKWFFWGIKIQLLWLGPLERIFFWMWGRCFYVNIILNRLTDRFVYNIVNNNLNLNVYGW